MFWNLLFFWHWYFLVPFLFKFHGNYNSLLLDLLNFNLKFRLNINSRYFLNFLFDFYYFLLYAFRNWIHLLLLFSQRKHIDAGVESLVNPIRRWIGSTF